MDLKDSRENVTWLRSGDLRVLAALLVCGGVLLATIDGFSGFDELSVTKNTPKSLASTKNVQDSSTLTLSVDVNGAELGELMLLPGIGLRLAERIIEEREFNGPYEKADDLLHVQGIGPKKLETLRPFVRFSPITKKRRTGKTGQGNKL